MSNDLDLRVKRPMVAPPKADWNWIDEGAALRYMIQRSGLQDKAIAIETGIDPAVLSKAQSGQARLNEVALHSLMDATGSEAWLFHWLIQRGYDPASLRRIETDLEAENRALKARIDQMEHDREVEAALFMRLRVAG